MSPRSRRTPIPRDFTTLTCKSCGREKAAHQFRHRGFDWEALQGTCKSCSEKARLAHNLAGLRAQLDEALSKRPQGRFVWKP